MSNILFVSYSFCMLLAVGCVMVTALQKPGKEQKTILMTTFFVAVTAFGYWESLLTDSLGMRMLAQKLIYIGGCNIYYLMLLFCLQYTRIMLPKKWKWIHWCCMFFNEAIMLSVLFCEYHPFFYKSISFGIKGGIPYLEKEYGFLHSCYIVSVFLYSVAIMAVGVLHWKRERRSVRRKKYGALGLILAIFLPTAFYVMEKLLDLRVYIVPFGLVLAESILIILVYYVKIYDVGDTATEYILKVLQDAIIIFDKKFRYKGSNSRAMELFPKLEAAAFDMEIKEIEPKINEIVQNELNHDIKYGEEIYMPTIRPVIVSHKIKAYVLWVRNVTSERQKEALEDNYKRDLEREVQKKTSTLQHMQEEMLSAFANMMENRDGVTGGHAKRTGAYANAIVEGLMERRLFVEEMDEDYAYCMKLAAPLHDIGKIAIPDNILNKSGPYSDEEYSIMKGHSVMGAKILEENLSSLENQDFYFLIRDMAHYHHEKWNGTGYPEGRRQKEIPLCARVMAVADVFDALVSRRPYKEAYSVADAYAVMTRERGISFDPDILDCFVEIRPRIEEIFTELNQEGQ